MEKSISIIITNKCCASCQICCMGCSASGDIIDEALMMKAISQAKELGCIDYISFSGGEPFLCYELLKKGLKYAKELGFKTSVATNGYWGGWPDKVLTARIRELPIDNMIISSDFYHRQYISENDLERAVETAKKCNIKLEIDIGETKSKSGAEYFRMLGPYKYLKAFRIYPFKKAGRAKELPNSELCRCSGSGGLSCGSKGSVAVLYDGKVFPCCEPIVFDTALVMGDLHERGLSEILSSPYNKAFFTMLEQNGGLDQIIEIAEDRFGFVRSKLCADSCEICHTLFENKKMSQELISYIEQKCGEETGEKAADVNNKCQCVRI